MRGAPSPRISRHYTVFYAPTVVVRYGTGSWWYVIATPFSRLPWCHIACRPEAKLLTKFLIHRTTVV